MSLAATFGRRVGGVSEGLVFVGLIVLVSAAIVLGGGTRIGRPPDEIVYMLSVPMFLAVLVRISQREWPKSWRWPLLIAALSLALPLLQLIPLTPGLWTALPGRDVAVQSLEAAGIPVDWRPLSLAPHATIYAFLSLLPAAALFLGVLPLDVDRRYALLPVPLGLGALGALLGLAQQVSHNAADISLSGGANVGYAIGFFANRNHFTASLYALLPLAAAYTARSLYNSRRLGGLATIYGAAVIGCLLAGVAVSFSRAGIALSIAAVLGSALIIWQFLGGAQLGRRPVIIIGSGLVLFAVVAQLGFIDLLIQRSAVDESRSIMARLTWQAIDRFSYAGSGFGTFVPVFMSFEQPTTITTHYINHAHNDWLEVTLEGGIAAAALMAAFLGWFALRCWTLWKPRSGSRDVSQRMLARAASLTIVLLLLHSLFDYPLRTGALLSLFAVACALVCTPGGDAAKRRAEAR